MDGLTDADAAPLAAAAAAAAPQQQQKRDEWSESGISRLLEAYEAKWLLRNRAKLKWSDWVDIANEVSVHCSSESAAAGKPGGSSAKTPNQCKNKVESMKKRYRAESAAAARAGPGAAANAAGPSWRFFGRMDGLLKGPAAGCSGQVQVELRNGVVDPRAQPAKAEPEVEVEGGLLRQLLPDAGPGALSDLVNADANGFATERAEKVDCSMQKESRAADSDANVSSPRSKEAKEDVEEVDKVWDMPNKRRKSSEFDIGKSIELLASSFLKIEQARMEMYRETEKMRVEAEIKKGEMELKRTEIMAKTQLQIAKLFAKRLKECSKTGGSSSVTDDVDTLAKKGENGSG